MNHIIDKLPEVIPNAYVINSSGCPAASDKLHFTAEGYRVLGTRYGLQMLNLLGYKASATTYPIQVQTTGNAGR
jgi:hypothetical protein